MRLTWSHVSSYMCRSISNMRSFRITHSAHPRSMRSHSFRNATCHCCHLRCCFVSLMDKAFTVYTIPSSWMSSTARTTCFQAYFSTSRFVLLPFCLGYTREKCSKGIVLPYTWTAVQKALADLSWRFPSMVVRAGLLLSPLSERSHL